jgi:hypothetical protein
LYGKVYASLYDGTLYGHWEAIVTMQLFIVLATPDGIVDMTPNAIAARTSIPLDIVKKGITKLEEADPYSRTPGDDGRRIVLIDDHRPWGWRLVNHGKYMRLRNMDQKREADRERIAEKRNKNKDVAIVSHPVADVAHSDSDLDSDLDSKKKHRTTAKAVYPDSFEVLWKAYPSRSGNNPKDKAYSAYRSRLAEGHQPAEILDGVGRYAKFCEQTGKLGSEFVLQAKTFLGPSKGFSQPWVTEVPAVKYDA